MKLVFIDIETAPLPVWVWRMGKQVVRHNQLLTGKEIYDIICICYCFNDGKKAKSLTWEDPDMIQKFDDIIRSSEIDYVIGKNSDRFDIKHINAQRMFQDLSGMPEWNQYTEDLEKQMRRHFILPSQSLDYISARLGLGGKDKMEFQDWKDIVEHNDNYGKSLTKMVKYCKKDVEDTREIWEYCKKHFTPKWNESIIKDMECCTHCGSTKIRKNGVRQSGSTKWQMWFCNSHSGHAGKTKIRLDSKHLGR